MVESESVSGVAEGDATLEAHINPEGLETAYSFWLGHEVCKGPGAGYEKQCYIEVMGPLGEGHIAAGNGAQMVSTAVTGLEANEQYGYVVAAVNSAGHVITRERLFRTLAVGGSRSEGSPPVPENTAKAYEPLLEPWVAEQDAAATAQQVANAEAVRKEEEEARAREAAKILERLPTPPTIESVSEASLANTRIVVGRGGGAAIKLRCAGGGHCDVKLSLSMGIRTKAGKGMRTRTVMLGTGEFSLVPGKTSTVRLKLNARSEAILKADGGYSVSARLAILEQSTGETLYKNVRLVRGIVRRSEGANG